MQKVIELKPKKHIYKLDYCSGCSDVIGSEYTEVCLPGSDDITHIALCKSCGDEAKREGII